MGFSLHEPAREYLLISLRAKISHLDIVQTVINAIDLCLNDWRPGEEDEVNRPDLSPGDGNRLTQITAVCLTPPLTSEMTGYGLRR